MTASPATLGYASANSTLARANSALSRANSALAAASRVDGQQGSGASAKAEQAARDFESVFLSTMLAPMFEGLNTEAPFGGGSAEKTWRGMLVEEYANAMVEAGGIGLSDAIRSELLQLQEM